MWAGYPGADAAAAARGGHAAPPRSAGRHRRARAAPGSRPWPRCCSVPRRIAPGSVTLNGVPLDRLGGRRHPHGGRAGRPGRPPLRHLHGREPPDRAGGTPPTASCARCSAGWGWPTGSAGSRGVWPPRWVRHGARLSGGQRQRVGVARALLADFPILVLDEPAEHLDPLAADALTADLLAVTDGRSLVLITHRLAGLETVDEILVIDDGPGGRARPPRPTAGRGRPVRRTLVGRDADRAIRRRPTTPDAGSRIHCRPPPWHT